MKHRILIVDDDLALLESMTAVLTSSGYEVDAAEGRGAAEELLLKSKPDLAVLDLMMEETDSGFVLGHRIKKLYPDVPIILLTAVAGTMRLSFAASRPDARSWVKADKIMDKPVRVEQLMEEIHSLLGDGPAGSEGR